MSTKRKVSYILLVVLVLAIIVGFVEYYRLSPRRHFLSTKPVVEPSHRSSAAPVSGINVLVMGSDARPGDTASHTDSILLCHINFQKNEYNVLSIPRDSRVQAEGIGFTKLTNVQYMGQASGNVKQGVIDAVQMVSNLTGVPIDYYAETNYRGLQDLVNSIGTIQMRIPFREVLTHPWYSRNLGKVFLPGTYRLNGEMVSEVVHERDSLPNGDYSRQLLQEEAIIGIAKALLQPANVPKLPAFFRTVPKFLIATNLSTEDMMSLALAGKTFSTDEVHYYQLHGQQETLYDDALRAYNDQVVLDQASLRQIITAHFVQ